MKKTNLFLALLVIPALLSAKDIDVRKSGAKPDGKTMATAAIQKAIDDVSAAGGGKVILSGGTFLSAALTLKSGVELFIDADSKLLASSDIEDFPVREIKHCNGPETFPRFSNKCFILADEAENIAITGRGRIDCNGDIHVREKADPNYLGLRFERILPVEKTLPRVVVFAGCRNVTVSDVTMVGQPGGWTFWVNDCDNAIFDRCRILSNVEYPNNDGIHINCSRNVSVSNCMIETGDDCIVVRALNRTLKERKICENVVVTNCTLRTSCYAIRLSFTGDGVIRNCAFSNLTIYDSASGIGLALPPRAKKNDWGEEESVVEGISFSNIQMTGISNYPIEFRIADHETVPVKSIRNISFSDVHCTGYRFPYLIGRPSAYLENIVFNNCSFTQIPYEECGCQWRHFSAAHKQAPTGLVTRFCKGIRFINTEFNTL